MEAEVAGRPHRSLPVVARDRRFSRSEFEAALKTQGKYISPVLLELGWECKRVWSTTGQYHRYWEPPAHTPDGVPFGRCPLPSATVSACRCRWNGAVYLSNRPPSGECRV